MKKFLWAGFRGLLSVSLLGTAAACGEKANSNEGSSAQEYRNPDRLDSLAGEWFTAQNPPSTVFEWAANSNSPPMVTLAEREKGGKVYRVVFMHGSTSNITHSVANALSKAKPSVAHLQGAHYVVTCFPGQMMAFLGKDAVALRKAEQDGGTRLSDFQSRYQISPNLTSGVLFHLARAVVGISFDGTTDVITNRFNKNRFKLQFTQEM